MQGATLELRANYNRKIQVEAGFTLQSSEFENPVQYIDDLEGITEFIRTPNDYGFATLSFTPNQRINANINYVYTGSMKVPHFAGAINQEVDEIITTTAFHEVSTKFSYLLDMKKLASDIALYAGIKNIFHAYQADFDIVKTRDSNFVFGPAQPRTFFMGLKFKM